MALAWQWREVHERRESVWRLQILYNHVINDLLSFVSQTQPEAHFVFDLGHAESQLHPLQVSVRMYVCSYSACSRVVMNIINILVQNPQVFSQTMGYISTLAST